MSLVKETLATSGHRALKLLEKPKVMARLATTRAQAALGRLPALYMADVNITKKCNFSCEHCFATAFDRDEPEPDTERVKATIKACKDAGVVFFNLQGGEPLVRRDLGEIVAACGPGETSVMINTNGFMLDRARIDQLVDWGVYGVLVSVDSLEAEVHDRMRRREGALQRILENLDHMQESGLVPHFLTVVRRGTVHTKGFADLVEFVVKRRIQLGLLVAQRVGEWALHPEVMCTPEELRVLDELNAKHPFIRRDTHNTLSTKGCPAFKYSVYVTPGGEVCPCPFVHVSYGNLHREPLEGICERALTHHWFRRFAERCPAAEDQRFIDQVQAKTWGAPKLPVPIADIVTPSDMPRNTTKVATEPVGACPVCGASERTLRFEAREHEYETTEQPFSFYACARCDALYLDPRPSKEALGLIYPPNYYSYDAPPLARILEPASGPLEEALAWRRRGRYDYLRPLVAGRGVRWLEIGASPGSNLLSAADAFGCEITGIDLGFAPGVTRTEKGTFIGADFEAYDFGGARFDVVYSAHLIEHLPSPVEYLRRCAELLEPGGLCVLETPNADSPLCRALGPRWGGLHVPRHFVLLGRASVRAAAERAGFDLVSMQAAANGVFLLWSAHALVAQGLRAPALADRAFPPRGILRRSAANFARFGAFDVASKALSAVLGDGENLHVVLRKRALL